MDENEDLVPIRNRNLTLSGRDFIQSLSVIKEVNILLGNKDVSISKKLTYVNRHKTLSIIFINYIRKNNLVNNLYMWEDIQILKSSLPKSEKEKLTSLEAIHKIYFTGNTRREVQINQESRGALEELIQNKISDNEEIKKNLGVIEREIEKELEILMTNFNNFLEEEYQISENLISFYKNKHIENTRVKNLDINNSVDQRLEYIMTDMKLLKLFNENLIDYNLFFYLQLWMKLQTFSAHKKSSTKNCSNILTEIYKDFIVPEKININFALFKKFEDLNSCDEKLKKTLVHEIQEQARIILFFNLAQFTFFIVQHEQNKWMQELTPPTANPSLKYSNIERVINFFFFCLLNFILYYFFFMMQK